MLFISRKDMWRRTLPKPDFNPDTSSATIFCVFGCDFCRGFGRSGTIAPALTVRSARKESRSEANLCKALSKSTSFKNEGVSGGIALMVTLLLLLVVPLMSELFEVVENRASFDTRDSL